MHGRQQDRSIRHCLSTCSLIHTFGQHRQKAPGASTSIRTDCCNTRTFRRKYPHYSGDSVCIHCTNRFSSHSATCRKRQKTNRLWWWRTQQQLDVPPGSKPAGAVRRQNRCLRDYARLGRGCCLCLAGKTTYRRKAWQNPGGYRRNPGSTTGSIVQALNNPPPNVLTICLKEAVLWFAPGIHTPWQACKTGKGAVKPPCN